MSLNIVTVLRMAGADMPDRSPRTLFTFNSKSDVSQVATGCDADIGGTSTVHFDLDESTAAEDRSKDPLAPMRPTARFWGDMRLGVRPEYQGKIRGGYAGFRNKPRPTLFGEIFEDVSNHTYLALRVRGKGHPRTRNSYYVNLQTDGPVTTDLWQHRLFFHREDGQWEDVFIPFESFVLTNTGEIVQHQIEMYREKIRTIGISILGGNSGVEGPYELNIDSIRAVNEEDVTTNIIKESTEGSQWERHAV
ncbi:hypothetical protein NM688_g8713 [Phlebia brevispora]|uniref:Uncharacterized protein n=1 Tax=Phlebia brevispora TaxID=194682 RepID=A0ACC1RQK0_9APHY|nr:hypothetical protein NM688_g8713 [Phlebia brevispora]